MPISGFQPLGHARHVEEDSADIPYEWRYVTDEGVSIRLTPLTHDILRVRLLGAGSEIARSWAVERTAWPELIYEAGGAGNAIMLEPKGYTLETRLEPFDFTVSWPDGTVFAEHDPARRMGLIASTGGARCYLKLNVGERIIGAGERTQGFDRRGTHIVFWNSDPPMLHTEQTGSMYASIPFWMVARPDGRVWGVFMDSVARSDLDAGASEPNLLSFGVEAGDLTFYLLAGPTPEAVLVQYSELTGRTPMPPRWALGYGQSRWSYFPEESLRAVAKEFRARRIPCDHLWLDIDYMDGYRVFTWSPTRFPDPTRLLSDLGKEGFRVVTIIDPGVKVDPTDPTYAEGAARDYFVRRPDGELFTGVVWPGESVFTDYCRADARLWWGDLHRALLDAGVAGIWDDMNEPALTNLLVAGARVPEDRTMAGDALQRPDGADGPAEPHAQLHNAYGLLMARATREGLERLRPNERAFVLSRAGYAGIQRYAAIWTGDNHSRWEHLALATRMALSLGISGIPFVGFDTGGFWESADGELLTRFTQLGALFPFFRNHSAIISEPQEPWAFGQPWESLIRQAIESRYRLLPYLYTLTAKAAQSGAPMTRPMIYHWHADPAVAGLDDQFTLGADLLAAPVLATRQLQRDVRFPAGCVWRDWLTGQRYVGPLTARVESPLDVSPLFQREGSIIPLGPVMQYVGEMDVEPLTLVCSLGPDVNATASGTLYEDDGETHDYKSGGWRETTYSAERVGDQLFFSAAALRGDYVARPRPLTFELRLLRADPELTTPDPVIRQAQQDGRPLDVNKSVSSQRRRYETVLRVALGVIAAPFTLTLTLA
jgi:alpha-glucosidase